jgi:hypothetical protein
MLVLRDSITVTRNVFTPIPTFPSRGKEFLLNLSYCVRKADSLPLDGARVEWEIPTIWEYPLD